MSKSYALKPSQMFNGRFVYLAEPGREVVPVRIISGVKHSHTNFSVGAVFRSTESLDEAVSSAKKYGSTSGRAYDVVTNPSVIAKFTKPEVGAFHAVVFSKWREMKNSIILSLPDGIVSADLEYLTAFSPVKLFAKRKQAEAYSKLTTHQNNDDNLIEECIAETNISLTDIPENVDKVTFVNPYLDLTFQLTRTEENNWVVSGDLSKVGGFGYAMRYIKDWKTDDLEGPTSIKVDATTMALCRKLN